MEICWSSQEQPGAARSSQEQPGTARSDQEQPGAPGATRRSHEQPGAARSSQAHWDAAPFTFPYHAWVVTCQISYRLRGQPSVTLCSME